MLHFKFYTFHFSGFLLRQHSNSALNCMQNHAHFRCEQNHVILCKNTCKQKACTEEKNINFAHPKNNINLVTVKSSLPSPRPNHLSYLAGVWINTDVAVSSLYIVYSLFCIRRKVNLLVNLKFILIHQNKKKIIAIANKGTSFVPLWLIIF